MSGDDKKTVRICHLSDLHLPLTNSPAPWSLLNKRILGYLNLRLNRGRTFKADVFKELLGAVVGEKADLVALTGDITSLAFDFEFAEASRLLVEAGLSPESTVVIPGNHDRYTVRSDLNAAFEKGMAKWLPQGFARHGGYPFVTRIGPVAFVALNTAVWRNPFRAAGRIDSEQTARLVEIVEREVAKGLWPVIAMHHPPFHLCDEMARDFRNGLDGLDDFVAALGEKRATIIHGHLHKFSRRRIKNLELFGVSAASNNAGDPLLQMGYCVYTFSGDGLENAEGVRYWPAKQEKERLERFELPQELLVDY